MEDSKGTYLSPEEIRRLCELIAEQQKLIEGLLNSETREADVLRLGVIAEELGKAIQPVTNPAK